MPKDAAVVPDEEDELDEEEFDAEELELLTSSGEEEEEDEDDADLSSMDTSKLKGRVRLVGEQEEKTATMKDLRAKKRRNEYKEIMKEFKAQSEPEDQTEIKVYRYPCYGFRRWLNCCVHVPMQEAVLENQSKHVRRFVRRWAKKRDGHKMMNLTDKKGRTALSLALKVDKVDMAETICSQGEVNVNLPDKGVLVTPLHIAVQRNQPHAIATLAHRALIPDPKDDQGMTPLMLASYLGHIDCVRELIDVDANPEKKDKRGWTPLHYAAAGEGDTETIEFLLKLGVPPRKKDKTGRRPIDWAKVAGNGEAEYTLEQFKVTLYDD
jgi:hypothetical protein